MASSTSARRRERNSPVSLRLRFGLGIAAVLVLLIGLNALVLSRETGKAKLTVPDAKLVDTTSGPLQVLDTGPPPDGDDGLSVVLIHGTAGAINWWDELIPRISPHRRVVALDLLGYGGSAKPGSDYSIDTQAALVAQVLSKIGISRAVVVGHSMGGSVAVALTAAAPDLVAGLVLIDTSPDREAGGLSLTARAARMPVIGPLIWRLAPDTMVRKSLTQAFAPGTPVADKYVDDLRAMTYPAYQGSARALDRYAKAASLPKRLSGTDIPLLVIFGEKDQIYPAREAISGYADLPQVKTVLIAGSGHSPQIETPKRTAAEILTLADQIEQDAAEAERARKLKRIKATRAAAARKRKAKKRRKATTKHKTQHKNKHAQKHKKKQKNSD